MGLIINACSVCTAQTGADPVSLGTRGCCHQSLFSPILQRLGFAFGAGTQVAATPLSWSPATVKPHAVPHSVPQFPHLLPKHLCSPASP